MKQYLDLLRDVLENGERVNDRTGVGTLSVFGRQMRFDLSNGFPLVTTKKVFFKGIVHELLWFLKGSTNVKYLQDNGVNIWNEWADDDGELGPVYGKQWRAWENINDPSSTIDQIKNVIDEIKRSPSSRRLIVSAWNPADVNFMALPPCHCLFQFNVIKGKLSCQLYQRSVDCGAGLPFNIASYALLTHMIAQICELQVGEFVHTSGDCHVYMNHIDGLKSQLQREPLPSPRLELNTSIDDINDFKYEDVKLFGYEAHPAIKLEIAV